MQHSGDRALRSEKEERWQRGHGELLRQLRPLSGILSVEPQKDFVVRCFLKSLGRKYFPLHLVAPAAPFREEIDEDQLVRFLRLFLRRDQRLQPCACKYLLAQQHRSSRQYQGSSQRQSSVAGHEPHAI